MLHHGITRQHKSKYHHHSVCDYKELEDLEHTRQFGRHSRRILRKKDCGGDGKESSELDWRKLRLDLWSSYLSLLPLF